MGGAMCIRSLIFVMVLLKKGVIMFHVKILSKEDIMQVIECTCHSVRRGVYKLRTRNTVV